MNQSQLLCTRAMLLSFTFLLITTLFSTVQAAGEVDTSFNPALINENFLYPYTSVQRIVTQPDGKVLIGGFFSAVGKINSYGIARLNADGTVDPTFHAPVIGFAAGLTYYSLNALAVQQNGQIIIGGDFISVAGQPRMGIARLNADGSFDPSFNITLGNIDNRSPNISDIKITADNKIIVVGAFTYNSGANKYLARLNSDGTIDASFNSPSVVNSQPSFYLAEILPSGKILLAASGMIFRLNTDGSNDTSFTSTMLNGGISAIKPLADGRIVVGGVFNAFNGFPITTANLIRVNADSSLDTSFNAGNTGPNGAVKKIEILSNNQLLIGGSFDTVNGVARKYIAKINADGSLDNSVNFSGSISFNDFALLANGQILLGGQAGGQTYNVRPALLKLTGLGSVDATQTVVGEKGRSDKVLVQPDGKILIGGNFTHTDNQRRYSLSRVNADGTLDSTFTPPDYNYEVLGLDIRADGKILVSTPNGSYRLNNDGSLDRFFSGGAPDAKFLPGGGAIISTNLRLRRYSESGVFDGSFDVVANSNIRKILLQPDGKFVVVGDFTTIAGVVRGRIARINADATLDTTFNPNGGASNSIFDAVLQTDGKIIIGGNFPGINFNNNYKYLARLNTDGSLDTSFNPIVEGGVQSLRIQPNGKILVGGEISSINGIPQIRIARVNQDGSLDTAFNAGAGADSGILSIDLQTNGNIVIGGSFTHVNNLDRLGIARLIDTAQARTPFDFDGDGRADVSVFRPSNGTWYLNQSTNGFTGAAFGQSGDKLAPADYDGDGKTDLAVIRSGVWYIQRSSLGFTGVQFGNPDDVPVPADYDGDGRADVAVFRPSNGTWYLQQSTGGFLGIQLGVGTDKPVPGDYNGDGRAEVAVYRPSNGTWYLSTNPATGFGGVVFGTATDVLVPADYDGDGKTDLAVFRPSNGTWYMQRSTAGFIGVAFGVGTDLPVPADYDGDGKADIAVVRNGNWYLNRSTQGFTGITFGFSDDKPLPNVFVR